MIDCKDCYQKVLSPECDGHGVRESEQCPFFKLAQDTETRKGFFDLVLYERAAQDAKWGFPQKNTLCEWSSILGEEFGEVAKELNELNFGAGSKERLINELVQVAAVCLSIIEHVGGE